MPLNLPLPLSAGRSNEPLSLWPAGGRERPVPLFGGSDLPPSLVPVVAPAKIADASADAGAGADGDGRGCLGALWRRRTKSIAFSRTMPRARDRVDVEPDPAELIHSDGEARSVAINAIHI